MALWIPIGQAMLARGYRAYLSLPQICIVFYDTSEHKITL